MNDDDKYTEAAEGLKGIYDRLTPEERKRDWDFWIGRYLREAVPNIRNGISFLEAIWRADGRLKFPDGAIQVEPEDFEVLYELAEETPEAFDLVRRICASRLVANADLSKEQSACAGEILSGARKRPKRAGRSRTENWARDVLIFLGVERTLQLGFQLEKWETSDSDCAFSLVAEAFNEAGRGMVTYDIVRNVWRNASKSGLKEELEKLNLAAMSFQLGDVDH